MRPYLDLLKIPGAAAFCAAALVARAGGAMMGIGTVMMVSTEYHSYALAGSVSAANVIAWAVGTAVLSNLVDRYGQRRVMLPAALVSAGTLAVLVVFGILHTPDWALFAPAVISGATGGAPGAMVRARWNVVVKSARQLHTAFSLESTLDELCFVVGPVAATFLATQVMPSAGLIAPVILGVVGSLWFYSMRATEPPVLGRKPHVAEPRRQDEAQPPDLATHPAEDAPAGPSAAPPAERSGGTGSLPEGAVAGAAGGLPHGAADESRGVRRGLARGARTAAAAASRLTAELILVMPGVAPVAIVTVMVGALFGACDVTVVAATDAWGVKPLSGAVLGAISLGSALGGLAYGSRNWVSSVARRWVICLGLLSLACVSVLFASDPLFLSLVGFAAGLTIAPTMINLNALMQSLVPTNRLTEGLAWVGTSLGIGVSAGAALAGQLIEKVGYQAGFVAMMTAGFVGTALALVRARAVARTAREVAAGR
ncbi:MAG: MFS transporter [Bifidobacteriaceae bacterium]|nr:MFS transporter [Bifidobacteriaceae bacterium]